MKKMERLKEVIVLYVEKSFRNSWNFSRRWDMTGERVKSLLQPVQRKVRKNTPVKDARKQKQKEIPATGHSWDEGKITKYPTATEVGERTYTCKSCGSTRTEAIDKDNSVRASGYNGSISWILYKDGKLVFKGDGAILNRSDTLEPWNSYKNYIFEYFKGDFYNYSPT